MLRDTLCTNVLNALETANNFVSLPGFSLVIIGLRNLYGMASECCEDEEEDSARLIAYCGAVAASLSAYCGKVKPDETCMRFLEDAGESLNQLCEIHQGNCRRSGLLSKLLSSEKFVIQSKRVKERIQLAIRAIMDLAQLQSMAEVCAMNEKVDTLLHKRFFFVCPSDIVRRASCKCMPSLYLIYS